MVLWIESQTTSVIILVVAALCYALAGAVLIAATLVARLRIAVELRALTPVMLTPLAVVAGLLIAFLASRVWANFDRANAELTQEAAALREIVLIADALPPAQHRAVRAGVVRYVHFIDAEDWPAMTAGSARAGSPAPGLREALTAILGFVPSDTGQRVAQQDAAAAIERALEARRSRIRLSKASVAPIQWSVIVVLDALILLVIALVHLDRMVTAIAGLLLFSTAMAACLVLLMANDRPFSAGGITLQPTELHDVGID
jgi:hypothetical protein